MSDPRGSGQPTVAAWQSLADSLLTEQCCAFHRNVEISSRYAWIYKLRPTCFKWAGMAAIASHHVRLALFPLRWDPALAGYRHRRPNALMARLLRLEDVQVIRDTNNAIFRDVYWAHLAYATDPEDGIGRLRALLRHDAGYAEVLAGFEAIDRGRRVLDDPAAPRAARVAAEELIWTGNVQLLEHEQRAMVQPQFDRLSCAFARVVSLGSTTTFEVRGVRRELAFFSSFYLYVLTHELSPAMRARTWPRITRYDDRWRWIEGDIVPRFRRFDADPQLVDASLQRIFREGREYAAIPCVPMRNGSVA